MHQLELKTPATESVKRLPGSESFERINMFKLHYQRIHRYATKKGRMVLRFQIRKLNNLILGL